MMNPSRWFGSNRYYDDDYYYDRYYGGPGYGYGGPGYGYGAPGYGYGFPGYGAPGYGYAAPPQTAPSAPATGGEDSSAKIKALEERIRQLESSQPRTAPGYDGSRYPAVPQTPQQGQAAQPDPYTSLPPSSSYLPGSDSSYRSLPPGSNYTPGSGTTFRPTD